MADSYSPPERSENREPNRRTAERLLQLVRDGDLVVFTDLRGYAVGYQLALRGYRWKEGACENPASGRRFSCRTFPRPLGAVPTEHDIERTASAADIVRADLEEDLAAAGNPERVIVVPGTYSMAGGIFAVPPGDLELLRQLVQLGYSPGAVDPRLGIVEYRRSVGGRPVSGEDAPHP